MLSSAINAAENTLAVKYSPPYPDVWGYDLSDYPAFKQGGGIVSAYLMEDGDIWFFIDYSHSYKDPITRQEIGEQYILIKFFKGEKQLLSAEEMYKLHEKTKEKKSINLGTNKAVFSDGSRLVLKTSSPPKLCFIPDFGLDYFEKTTSEGKIEKYSILGALPQVRTWYDHNYCEHQGADFFYQKLYFFSTLFNLDDDTFILFSSEGNLILRFDKNLNTQFKPVSTIRVGGSTINRNFFVINHSLIEELEKKYMNAQVPVYQTIHDELLKYFRQKYPVWKYNAWITLVKNCEISLMLWWDNYLSIWLDLPIQVDFWVFYEKLNQYCILNRIYFEYHLGS